MMRLMGDQLARLEERRQRFAQHWSDSTDNPLLAYYVKVMTQVTGAERCSIFINEPSTGKLWLRCGTELQERAIEVDQKGTVVGEVVVTGAPVRIEHAVECDGVHRSVDEATGLVTRSVLCVPIWTLDGQRIAGAVQLLNKHDGEFTIADQAQLEEMAHFLEFSIENLHFNQEMSGALDQAVKYATAAVFGLVATGLLLSVLLITYWVGSSAIAS